MISCSHGSDVSKLKFRITDTGVGIAPENHEKIFEDFVVISSGGKRQTGVMDWDFLFLAKLHAKWVAILLWKVISMKVLHLS